MEETFIVTLGKHRRISIPVGLGRALDVEPGDRLAWVIQDATVWLVNPVPTSEGTYRTGLVTKANAEGDDQPQDRERIAELFRELQEGDAFRAIVDPVAWQREQRTDRSLPGRTKQGEA